MFIVTEQQMGVEVAAQSKGNTARTAVVLGGTSGIGKEIVKSLAAKGSTVYLSGRTTQTAHAAAVERLAHV